MEENKLKSKVEIEAVVSVDKKQIETSMNTVQKTANDSPVTITAELDAKETEKNISDDLKKMMQKVNSKFKNVNKLRNPSLDKKIYGAYEWIKNEKSDTDNLYKSNRLVLLNC